MWGLENFVEMKIEMLVDLQYCFQYFVSAYRKLQVVDVDYQRLMDMGLETGL